MSKAVHTIALVIVTALGLGNSACARRPWLDTKANHIQVGRQHEIDIERLFGEPHGVVELDRHARCAERWAYSEDQSSAGRMQARVLFVDFDRTGVVCDYALGRLAD